MLALVLVAFSLGLSNFAAAIGIGVAGADAGTRVRVGVVFGIFEAGMPILGLALGHGLASTLGHAARWAGAGLLIATGTASYISVLERGYALHELTFALLFLLILAIPFRRRQRWAWWAAWIPMIGNLGYTFTFGIHDHAILTCSLIADIALPALLLAHIPALLPPSPPP